MDNKLEQLTRKLYDEGLAKGREEGERMRAQAEEKAKTIIKEAEKRAAEIAKKAASDADELRKNTLTEISLAGREAVAKIKDEVAGAIVSRAVDAGTKQASLDPEFIKEMLLAVAKNWNGAGGGANSKGKISLTALLPETQKKSLDAAFERSAAALLKEGVEVGYSADVHSGFRVGEKGGGYYIGFSDENFRALLGQYLREKVSKILFNK